jgi:hypothetical protein
MGKSIRVNTKKRGRGRPPTTGKGTLVGVRLQDELLSDIDDFAEAQFNPLTRPEAIRLLVETGLESLKKKPQT